jgi:RimJ/RimL family protein N-acetyltransferase
MSFELQPHLKGELIELRPLRPEDWNDLFAVASDPLIWEQHPENDRCKEDVFRIFFKDALESGGAFVVIDSESKRIVGSTRFHGFNAERSEIEIGWTFLARKCWGGRFNTEMKQVLLDHAFKFVESVVFFVGEGNVRSQRAMEKVGARNLGMVMRKCGNHQPGLNVKYLISNPKKSGVESGVLRASKKPGTNAYSGIEKNPGNSC